MNRKNELILAIGAVVVLITIILITAPDVDGEMTNLHLNMKDGDELAPETVGNPEHEGEQQRIEAEYVQLPGSRVNREWVEVGTWTSQPVESDFVIEGRVEFNIWFKVVDDGYDADADWDFHLYHNAEEIVYGDLRGSDESTEEIIEVTVANFTDGVVEVKEGDELSVNISYRGWEDCDIYFDCAPYDSGVEVNSDFLELFDLTAEGDKATVEVYDPFDTDWNEAMSYLVLVIDDELAETEDMSTSPGKSHNIGGKTVTGTIVEWTLTEGFEGGEEVEGWVKYTQCVSSEDRGLTASCTGKKDTQTPPEAGIRAITPGSAEEEEEVTFDGRDSFDEDGHVVRYIWSSDIDGEFYDGTSGKITKSDLSQGNHTITLKVQDDDDLWSSEVSGDLEITERPNTLPEITLLYPGDGIIVIDPFGTGTIDAEWEGSDADGDDLSYRVFIDTSLDFSGGGSSVDDEWASFIYLAPTDEDTSFYWKIIVSDGRDDVESETRSFIVRSDDTELVVIEEPLDGTTVSGTVRISGIAGERDGFIWKGSVDHVEVSVNGGQWTKAIGTGSWSFNWDSTAVVDGPHTLMVRVFDGSFYSTGATLQVFVDNPDKEGGGDSDEDDGIETFLLIGISGAIIVVAIVTVYFTRYRGYDEYGYYGDEYSADEYDEDDYYDENEW